MLQLKEQLIEEDDESPVSPGRSPQTPINLENLETDSIFAVNAAVVGQQRLFSMDELIAGLTEVPLCQAAHSCNGDSTWLQLMADVAPQLQLPRTKWYDALLTWSVRCMPIERFWGSNQVQWGVLGGPEGLPSFLPGVVSLLPCLPIAQTLSVANAMVATQTGQQRKEDSGLVNAAVNGTVCT